MTVLMTLRVAGDGTQLEKYAAENARTLTEVIETAKRHGVLAHRFYASDDEVLVVDRWPSEDAFHAFFGEAGPRIQELMAGAGMSGEPQISFWRELEIGDEIG